MIVCGGTAIIIQNALAPFNRKTIMYYAKKHFYFGNKLLDVTSRARAKVNLCLIFNDSCAIISVNAIVPTF
jgi:hypothetical protein